MAFKIEFDGGTATEWHLTDDGARAVTTDEFVPSIYVDGSDRRLADLESVLATDPKVAGLGYDRKYTSLHADERSEVFRVDLERPTEIRRVARWIRRRHEMDAAPPGTVRLFDVDLTPQFRYCLDTDTSPVPDGHLSTFEVGIDGKSLVDGDVSSLAVDGDGVSGSEPAVLESLDARLRGADPDVLIVSDARLVPLLFEKADAHGLDSFRLGRRPGYTKLAGANTLGSYGRVGHSPARYDVPGRVLIDESNSFLWSETSVEGLLDLVEFSWKPLQETAWASIGNVFTAIQIREAVDRDVLIPWNKWEPEQFKDLRTLHAADRDGVTFAPDVGLHEDVVEVDFSSLYPRIMITRNVSPDTICCDCHADREDVPEIGYNVCDERGFLTDVLDPVVDHRVWLKAQARQADDPDERREYEVRSNAFKWILVSCFGYQGYRNSKFGRIECHEAINAVARDILLTAKEHFEEAGWRVVHGIVDSLWVARRDGDARPVDAVAEEVADAVDVPLEPETEYDWIAFVPRRDSNVGALTKYFGTVAGNDEYKLRGIEARQRSTPSFVEDVQMDLIEALDDHRSPEPVCDRLGRHLAVLRAGDVPPNDLVIRTRVSKRLAAYTRDTHSRAALARARRFDVDYAPGQDVRYVVVDGDARTPERVRLHFEGIDEYDDAYYERLLIRAAESVLSPLGWDRARIRGYLDSRIDATLSEFYR